jgi:esterase/lipase superfamily enzyme
VFDYDYDKESTNYSRVAFEQTLRTLAKDPDVKDVTVMAHSMGTWLAMESLRQMAIRDGRVASKIDNVILASPDIDVDVFAPMDRDGRTPSQVYDSCPKMTAPLPLPALFRATSSARSNQSGRGTIPL